MQPLSGTPQTSHPRKWLIVALVLVAECMDLLDGTIVNVAAPSISSELHANASALQWITGGYALAFAVGLITGARLGDIYGRKRIFLIGSIGFVLASMACAFAVDPAMLIGFRLVQGGFAALLIPQGLGIIRSAFSTAELGKAFGIFGPVIGLSAVLGPIIGGVLVDADLFGTGWRLVFWVNLPLGLVAAIGAARVFPESRLKTPPRLDIVGTLLVAAFAGLLIYPLIQGRESGWPAWTYVMMAVSGLVFAGLILWTRRRIARGQDPLVVPSIFADRGFSAGLATIMVVFGGMIGTLLVLTVYLQLGEHFSAIRAGLSLAPFAFGIAIGAGVGAGVLVPRLGRIALQIGAVVMAGGTIWVWAAVHSNGLSTSAVDLIGPLLTWGTGLGMLVAPLFNFVLAAVTDAETGSASGVLNAVQQLAGAVGIAIIGTVFFSAVTHSGFVSGLTRCLVIELCLSPVLLALTFLLPAHPVDEAAVLLAEAEAESARTSVSV